MEEQKRSTTRREGLRTKEPSSYLVIIHNDDVTTFDFVEMLLMYLFNKTEEEATRLAIEVDAKGSGVAGRYSYDIAKSKSAKGMEMAEDAGFPLKLTVRKE